MSVIWEFRESVGVLCYGMTDAACLARGGYMSHDSQRHVYVQLFINQSSE